MPVLFEKRGGVAILTLSRPERRNAWCPAFDEELRAHFATVEADDYIRCVVLTGDEAGKAFSAGADLKEPSTHRARDAATFVRDLGRSDQLALALPADCPKPVISAVNGYAIGIGCTLTYACDLIIASERAEWRLPQVGLGLLPKFGSTAGLARWIGQGMAMRLALGFPMGAEEAFRCGLAQWLTPHADLMAETMAVAERIASYPPLAPRMVKESLRRGMDTPNLRDAALVDLYRFMVLEHSEDARRRHEAWRNETR